MEAGSDDSEAESVGGRVRYPTVPEVPVGRWDLLSRKRNLSAVVADYPQYLSYEYGRRNC